MSIGIDILAYIRYFMIGYDRWRFYAQTICSTLLLYQQTSTLFALVIVYGLTFLACSTMEPVQSIVVIMISTIINVLILDPLKKLANLVKVPNIAINIADNWIVKVFALTISLFYPYLI